MAHGTRIRLDPAWATGSLWQSSEQSALDAALFRAVNGDGGGTYAPSSTLEIGGAGMRFVATEHGISGGGSAVRTSIASAALLVHGDSDYCELGAGHAGASLTTTSPVLAARWSTWPAAGNGWLVSGQLTIPFLHGCAPGVTARVPLRVHNGATLASVTFPFQVNGSSAPTPAQLPRFGVFAVAKGQKFPLSQATPYQAVPVPLNPAAWTATTVYATGAFAQTTFDNGYYYTATTGGTSTGAEPTWPTTLGATVPDGSVVWTCSGHTSWVYGNQTQTFTYACDAPSANPYCLIDTSRFSYFAEIVDASGAGANQTPAVATGLLYLDLLASFTNVLDIRPR